MDTTATKTLTAWIPMLVILIAQLLTVGYFVGDLRGDVEHLTEKVDDHLVDDDKHMPRAEKDKQYASAARLEALEKLVMDHYAETRAEFNYRRDWMQDQTERTVKIESSVVTIKGLLEKLLEKGG